MVKKIGIEITRVGKDYLGIKHKNAKKATRLKGPAFSEGVLYADLVNQSEKPAKLTETERNDVKKRLARAMKNRQRSLEEYLDNAPKVMSAEKPEQEVIKLDTSNLANVRKEQPQATPDLPQIYSPLVRKFKAG